MALAARYIYGLRRHPCSRFMSHSTWLAFVLELNIFRRIYLILEIIYVRRGADQHAMVTHEN